MHVVFYASTKPREQMLAKAFGLGVAKHGHSYEVMANSSYVGSEIPDIAVFFGVKGNGRFIVERQKSAGKHSIMLDKGYTRTKGVRGHTAYTRVIVDNFSPESYMMNKKWPSDRLDSLSINFQRKVNNRDGHILFCGSTQKYYNFHQMGELAEPTAYAEHVIAMIRQYTGRHVIYRPKPSQNDPSIDGVGFSGGREGLWEALVGCHAVVTHGATAAMESVLSGIPAIVLGSSIASPVSEKLIENIENPFFPDDALRYKWACSMAYCQWTLKEIIKGDAFGYFKIVTGIK